MIAETVQPTGTESAEYFRAVCPVHIQTIIAVVCDGFGIEQADLGRKCRHKRVVWSRRLVWYLARQYTTLSTPELAKATGRPNHSTVLSGLTDLALARGFTRGSVHRLCPWKGSQADVDDAISDAIKSLGPASKPIREDTATGYVLRVMSDRKPRTAREIHSDAMALGSRHSAETIRNRLYELRESGAAVKAGAKQSAFDKDAIVWCYVLSGGAK